MPITIGSNISSLNAQRRLAENSTQLSSTYEKLSSGLRINKASDDSAGLAIAESLKSNRAVFVQGIRNLNDGISLLSIADSAVENLSNIVVRLKELAEQAANGSYGPKQRAALDQEAQSLSDEYLRIAQSTTFNKRQLFSASFGDLRLQGGFGVDGSILSNLGGAIGLATFGNRTIYNIGAGGSQNTEVVNLADVNGDGHLDLIALVDDGSDGFMSVSLGTGNGTFGAATSYYKNGSSSQELEVADFNNDGHLDLIADSDAGLQLRLGNGDGTFKGITYISDTPSIRSLAIGDLNGDGIADLAFNTGATGNVSIRLGNGDGTFGSVSTIAMESTLSWDVELEDINNDGVLDLVTAGTSAGTGAVTFRLGNGDGTFGASSSYQMGGASAQTVVVGDLNRDGNLDVVVGSVGNSIIRLGSGDGTFGAASTYAGVSNFLGDLNGDGNLDLLIASGSNPFYFRLGAGDGTFGSITPVVMDDDQVNSVALGDLNGDGVYDLVTGGYSASISDASAAVRLQNTTPGIGALLDFSLATIADSRQALSLLSKTLNNLGAQRGVIGAFQARLSVATNVLSTSSENYASAESRIRDADIADEVAKLTSRKILQQAATAILAQANQQPAIAISLLNGNASI